MTSADLGEEYAAVLVERHETVKNDGLKLSVASFSYKRQWNVLAEGQETTKVQQLPVTQSVLDMYIYHESMCI